MLSCGRYKLSLDRPLIMGIVNVTPDSFSDGGRYVDPARAIAHGLQLCADGADILDIGGESTRPGAQAVSEREELTRVLPVLAGLSGCGVPISVDTCKPVVMRAAIAAGADMINDVSALQEAGALDAVREASSVALCLMHKQGSPVTMQLAPQYTEVVQEVSRFLSQRVQTLLDAGFARDRLVIDPGFGFGKTLAHNTAMLRQLGVFSALGVPLLVGLSRKSMLGAWTGLPVGDRLIPSVVSAILAAERGARILRVHDVKETKQALDVLAAVEDFHG